MANRLIAKYGEVISQKSYDSSGRTETVTEIRACVEPLSKPAMVAQVIQAGFEAINAKIFLTEVSVSTGDKLMWQGFEYKALSCDPMLEIRNQAHYRTIGILT